MTGLVDTTTLVSWSNYISHFRILIRLVASTQDCGFSFNTKRNSKTQRTKQNQKHSSNKPGYSVSLKILSQNCVFCAANKQNLIREYLIEYDWNSILDWFAQAKWTSEKKSKSCWCHQMQ